MHTNVNSIKLLMAMNLHAITGNIDTLGLSILHFSLLVGLVPENDLPLIGCTQSTSHFPCLVGCTCRCCSAGAHDTHSESLTEQMLAAMVSLCQWATTASSPSGALPSMLEQEQEVR